MGRAYDRRPAREATTGCPCPPKLQPRHDLPAAAFQTGPSPGPPGLEPSRRYPSCQRVFAVLETSADFCCGAFGASIFVLNECADRISLRLQKLQHLLDRRVALSPRRVLALILLSVFDVQHDNAIVI